MPLNFPQPTSAVNVNYDFTDFLENTGYVILYGMTDTAGNYYLTRNQLESSTASTTATDGTTPVEVNFDYTFLVATKLKGKLTIVATYAADNNASNTSAGKVTFEPIHYDGSTETSLASSQVTDTVSNPANVTQTEMVDTLVFSIDRYFKVGEILRIEAIIEAINFSAGSPTATLYHDGANRNLTLVDDKTNAAADSNLKVVIPLVIDS